MHECRSTVGRPACLLYTRMGMPNVHAFISHYTSETCRWFIHEYTDGKSNKLNFQSNVLFCVLGAYYSHRRDRIEPPSGMDLLLHTNKWLRIRQPLVCIFSQFESWIYFTKEWVFFKRSFCCFEVFSYVQSLGEEFLRKPKVDSICFLQECLMLVYYFLDKNMEHAT